MLLLLQITAKRFQTSPEVSSQWSTWNHVWDFLNFENWNFNDCFSFALTWDPMAAKISKRYHSLKSVFYPFKLFMHFLLSGPHESTFWIFEIFSFRFLTIFKKKSTIVPYGETKNLNYLENERKGVKFWPQGWVFGVYRYFWDLSGKVILGSLGAFPIFDNLVPWKWMVVEWNGVKFGPKGWVFSVYRILVKLNASGNSGGNSVHFGFSKQVLEWKIHLDLYVNQFLCGHCLPSWQAERQDRDLLVFFLIFYEYFSFSLTWDPMGKKISKRYFSYKSQPNVLKLFLNFPPNGPHKSTFWYFWNFEFLIFNDFFFENSKFTIVAYREIKNLETWRHAIQAARFDGALLILRLRSYYPGTLRLSFTLDLLFFCLSILSKYRFWSPSLWKWRYSLQASLGKATYCICCISGLGGIPFRLYVPDNVGACA